MSKQVLCVFGATGNQGGSVVRTVLNTPKLAQTYALRGVTRDVSKPAAKALAADGVEVITADLNDANSVLAAIRGCSAVFGVTNFWESASADVEFHQGKNITDACKSAGVQHFIWSSLPNTKALTGGKLQVTHFDSKAKVEDYVTSLKIPASFMMPGFFISNLPGAIRLSPEGYKLHEPWTSNTQIPLLNAAEDVGKFVGAILLAGQSTFGKHVPAATGYFTPDDIVRQISEGTGMKAEFVALTDEQFKANVPPSKAEELLANFELIRDPGYYGPHGPAMLQESLALFEGTGIAPPSKPAEFFRKTLKKE